MNELVFGVIIDNEFVEEIFIDSIQVKSYIDDLNITGLNAKAVQLPKYMLKGIFKIQRYANVYPDANTIISEAGKLLSDDESSFYHVINSINENAFAKEYFDYFVENKLLISADPNFNEDMALLKKTLSYEDYLRREIDFLNGVIEALGKNKISSALK